MTIWLRKNWFIVGIAAALGGGFLLPVVGAVLNPGSATTDLIVVILFLLTGLTLPSEQIGSGLRNARLHLLVQLFVFVVAPLYFFLSSRALGGLIDPGLVIGIVALGCLPTTVSSCIVFTQVSGGNVVATIFNATLANLGGVFLSPLLLSLFLSTAGTGLPPQEFTAVFINLALKMLLPVAVGQVLRLIWTRPISARRRALSTTSSVLILLIVFFSAARSAGHPALHGGLAGLAVPALYLAASHLLLVALVLAAARLMRLPPEDRISALYAAPQKTLALGVPLLSVYFADDSALLGVAILPILFYHPFQLLVAGFIRSSRLARTA